MKHLAVVTGMLVSAAVLALPAHGFESVWTDQFEESTYRITGPDAAAVGDTVEIVITARDPFYPNAMVASPWSFLEDSVEVDGGFGVFLSDTTWQRVYTFAYETPGTHLYTFTAQDLGHGGGAHSWEWFVVEGTTGVGEPTGIGVEGAPVAGLSIMPNPTRGDAIVRYTAPDAGSFIVQLFDPRGRLIRFLPEITGGEARAHEWRWDGTDSDGAPVAPGVYLYVLSGSDLRRSGRVVVLR